MKLFQIVLLAGVVLAVALVAPARVASANASTGAHLAQSSDAVEQKKAAPPRPRPKPGPKDGGEDE